MKSYQFRFTALMDLRRRERDEAGAEMGKVNEAIRRIDQQIDETCQQQQQLRKDNSQRQGVISVDALLSAGRFEMQLEADRLSLQETRQQLIVEQNRRQNLLVAAEAELKRFEKLDEKERMRFRELALKHDQAELDDDTVRRYTMRRTLRRRGNE